MRRLRVAAHVQHELVVHLDEVVQDDLATLMEKARHQGMPFLILEALDVFGAITSRDLGEVVGEGRLNSRHPKTVEEEILHLAVAFEVPIHRLDRRRRWVLLQLMEERPLLTLRRREECVDA